MELIFILGILLGILLNMLAVRIKESLKLKLDKKALAFPKVRFKLYISKEYNKVEPKVKIGEARSVQEAYDKIFNYIIEHDEELNEILYIREFQQDHQTVLIDVGSDNLFGVVKIEVEGGYE